RHGERRNTCERGGLGDGGRLRSVDRETDDAAKLTLCGVAYRRHVADRFARSVQPGNYGGGSEQATHTAVIVAHFLHELPLADRGTEIEHHQVVRKRRVVVTYTGDQEGTSANGVRRCQSQTARGG